MFQDFYFRDELLKYKLYHYSSHNKEDTSE